VYFPVVLPAVVLLVPFLDLLLAVVRRVRRGRSPFAPDKLHLHHRLLDIGHSHRNAVLIMCLWTAVISFGTVITAFVPLVVWLPVWIGVALASLALTTGPLRGRSLRRPEPADRL
jgi:UDP-GlcNAc:undecaprenyl-phosphate GlcNAc-1-phosphate transferase